MWKQISTIAHDCHSGARDSMHTLGDLSTQFVDNVDDKVLLSSGTKTANGIAYKLDNTLVNNGSIDDQ